MAVARPVAEPFFWVSLLVGIIGFPLLVWGRGQGLEGQDVLFGSVVLLGFSGFGFGATLLAAAYGPGPLHPPLVLAAALGALAGGLFAVSLAAEMVPGLRLFAFMVLIVDAAGVASTPRAWRLVRDAETATPRAEPAEGDRS